MTFCPDDNTQIFQQWKHSKIPALELVSIVCASARARSAKDSSTAENEVFLFLLVPFFPCSGVNKQIKETPL